MEKTPRALFFRCPFRSVMSALPASHCQHSLPHAPIQQQPTSTESNSHLWSLQMQSWLGGGGFSPLPMLPLYSLWIFSTEFTTQSVNYYSQHCQLKDFYILRAIFIINQSRRPTNTLKWDTITTTERKIGFRFYSAANFQVLMAALNVN